RDVPEQEVLEAADEARPLLEPVDREHDELLHLLAADLGLRRLPSVGGRHQLWSLRGVACCRGARKPSSARTQGASIADAIGATEDAAMRRVCSRAGSALCPGATTTSGGAD